MMLNSGYIEPMIMLYLKDNAKYTSKSTSNQKCVTSSSVFVGLKEKKSSNKVGNAVFVYPDFRRVIS